MGPFILDVIDQGPPALSLRVGMSAMFVMSVCMRDRGKSWRILQWTIPIIILLLCVSGSSAWSCSDISRIWEILIVRRLLKGRIEV